MLPDDPLDVPGSRYHTSDQLLITLLMLSISSDIQSSGHLPLFQGCLHHIQFHFMGDSQFFPSGQLGIEDFMLFHEEIRGELLVEYFDASFGWAVVRRTRLKHLQAGERHPINTLYHSSKLIILIHD